MKWQTITALFVVGLIVVGVVYDIIVYSVAGDEATISRTLLGVEGRFLFFAICFAFSLGVLVGHLFLPQHVAG